MFCICNINAVELGDDWGVGLFLSISYFNHSCANNCSHVHQKAGVVGVQVVQHVKAGEEITFSYLGDTYLPTSERRKSLQRDKFFLCNCERCIDPTEGGRHVQSVKCLSCNFFASQTLDQSWVCQSCGTTEHSAPERSKEVKSLYDRACTEMESDEDNNGKEMLESLLTKFESLLHPNHYVLFNSKIQLVGYLHNAFHRSSAPIKQRREMLQRSEFLCREVIRSGEDIFPPYHKELGQFYLRLGWILRDMKKTKTSHDALQTAYDHYSIALGKDEPETLQAFVEKQRAANE